MGLAFAYFVFIALVMFAIASIGAGVGLSFLGIASVAAVISCLLVIIQRLEEIRDELRYRNDAGHKEGDNMSIPE
jgi:hypothetical protein